MPNTVDRVAEHTSDPVNARIRQAAEERVTWLSEHREAIDHELRRLDEEWDIERTLEANAATLALTGTVLAAATGRRGWLLLPLAVSGFLLQHAVEGWCPPIEVFRRLGVRTPREIEIERHALKALRGDYDVVSRLADGRVALRAAE